MLQDEFEDDDDEGPELLVAGLQNGDAVDGDWEDVDDDDDDEEEHLVTPAPNFG